MKFTVFGIQSKNTRQAKKQKKTWPVMRRNPISQNKTRTDRDVRIDRWRN